MLGILIATLLNHALAAALEAWGATKFDARVLGWILGLGFIAFGVWTLFPDRADAPGERRAWGPLLSTIVVFFLAEMGDKTQLATVRPRRALCRDGCRHPRHDSGHARRRRPGRLRGEPLRRGHSPGALPPPGRRAVLPVRDRVDRRRRGTLLGSWGTPTRPPNARGPLAAEVAHDERQTVCHFIPSFGIRDGGWIGLVRSRRLDYIQGPRTKGEPGRMATTGLRSYPALVDDAVATTLAVRETGPVGAPKPRLLDQVRQAILARHYSRRTEKAYVHWIKRFIFFHGKRHPIEMGAAEVTAFLTALAVLGKVAAATQNQALSALLFLYRNVLMSNSHGSTASCAPSPPSACLSF